MPVTQNPRREFLTRAVLTGLAVPSLAIAVPQPFLLMQEQKAGKNESSEEISPAEDLMREHGLLNRILLIYDEHLRRLEAKQEFDPGVLKGAAAIMRKFVGDDHEKLEED